jgi:hypothetical protein
LGRIEKRGIARGRREWFDALLTMAGSMVHQQNLRDYLIAVIALQARSNRLADTPVDAKSSRHSADGSGGNADRRFVA